MSQTDLGGGVPWRRRQMQYTPVAAPTWLPATTILTAHARTPSSTTLPRRIPRFPHLPFTAPLSPLVDPPAPTHPFSLYPAIVQPVRRRPQARLGTFVMPIRLADTTAIVPPLSWDGVTSDWLARRRPVPTGARVTSWAAVIPFLDPSLFGWRGVAPAWLARRQVATAPQPQGILATPVQFPIPETSWLGEYPDWIAQAARVPANGGFAWEPNDRPNPPSPDLAWGPSYPDRVWAAARAIDRLWHTQPPRVLAFVPDLVGGLSVWPDRIARRTLPTAAQRVWNDRFAIVIPDLRRDWGPAYPDRLARATAAIRTIGTFSAAEGDRAVSPLDWYTQERDVRVQIPRRPTMPYGWIQPPDGSLVVISEYGWIPVTGMRRPQPWIPPMVTVRPLTPNVASTAVTCIEMVPDRLTAPGLCAGVLTGPRLLDGRLGGPALTQGDLC